MCITHLESDPPILVYDVDAFDFVKLEQAAVVVKAEFGREDDALPAEILGCSSPHALGPGRRSCCCSRRGRISSTLSRRGGAVRLFCRRRRASALLGPQASCSMRIHRHGDLRGRFRREPACARAAAIRKHAARSSLSSRCRNIRGFYFARLYAGDASQKHTHELITRGTASGKMLSRFHAEFYNAKSIRSSFFRRHHEPKPNRIRTEKSCPRADLSSTCVRRTSCRGRCRLTVPRLRDRQRLVPQLVVHVGKLERVAREEVAVPPRGGRLRDREVTLLRSHEQNSRG